MRLIVASVLALVFIGCASDGNADRAPLPRSSGSRSGDLHVQAFVLEFREVARVIHRDDERRSIPAVLLRIVEPYSDAGDILVYLDGPVPKDSAWRKFGHEMRFAIDVNLLRGGKDVWAKDLRPLGF